MCADLHENKYDHTWLPIESGFKLIVSSKKITRKERFINYCEMGKFVCSFWKRVQNVTIEPEGNGKYVVERTLYKSLDFVDFSRHFSLATSLVTSCLFLFLHMLKSSLISH